MRSLWKINKINKFYLNKYNNLIYFGLNNEHLISNINKKNIYNKNYKISKEVLGSIFSVYNGHIFVKINIKENKKYLKKNLGMFIFTRKNVKHPTLKKDQNK